LSPDPSPRMARPPEISSMLAMALPVTTRWRVSGLVTSGPRRTGEVLRAARVRATYISRNTDAHSVMPTPVQLTEPAKTKGKKRTKQRRKPRVRVMLTFAPTLLSLPLAAHYTSLSQSTVLALEESGALKRVPVVIAGREIRKRLYAAADLDRLVAGWKR